MKKRDFFDDFKEVYKELKTVTAKLDKLADQPETVPADQPETVPADQPETVPADQPETDEKKEGD